MNVEHLRTFVWLRWRLRVNMFKKGGTLSTVLFVLMAALAVVAAVGLSIVGFLLGLFAFDKAPPGVILYVWDGLVMAFLFGWMVGLMTELHRPESLALDRFLHLPVSLSGAFLVNYVSSLASFSLLAFVPGMAGLILGLTFARGPAMLLALPLLAAFVLAVTAVTYQFQGWLASLMTNPRRRRTVIVFVTAGFILLFQLPNIANMLVAHSYGPDETTTWQSERMSELQKDHAAGKVPPAEFQRRYADIQRESRERREGNERRGWEDADRLARLVHLFLPPGWLPLGAAGLADGNVLPALLGTLGLTLIGWLSLRRAYRTTLRLYTGHSTATGGPAAVPTAAPAGPPRLRLVEWQLPGVSEQAAAVATAGFRSLMRAPESKMVMIVPLIMIVVFGSAVWSTKAELPYEVRPLAASGVASLMLLTVVQLVGNQFGYDRAGFRAYVLSPAPRREVLFGKNLAVAPLAVGFGSLLVLITQVIFPMRLDHLLATLAQLTSTFLVFCLLANVLSILAPIPIAAGSSQPATVRVVPVLMHMAFLMVFPVAMLPTLMPLGIEFLLAELWDVRGWPVALGLSLLVLAAAVLAYRQVLTWEGNWLAAREQAILEVVTAKAE